MNRKAQVRYVAFLTGTSGRIVSWNSDCEQLLGHAAPAVLHHRVTSLLPPERRAAVLARLRGAGNQSVRLRTVLQRADGGCTSFAVTLVPQFRQDGKAAGFCVIVATRAVAVTASTFQSECEMIRNTPLKDMIDYLTGTFYVINQAGRLINWNRRVETATRMSARELAGIDVRELFHPDEQGLIADKIRRVFEHNGEVMVEANLLSRNGPSTPFLFSGSRFRANGTYYLCGTGLDVTERHKQEEQLRLRDRALHASSNGIIITRCAGRRNPIEYVNPAFERITGYAQHEVLGRDPRFMAARGLDESERVKLRIALDELRETSVIFRNRRKDGELFWNDLTVTPVLDEKGVTTHFIGVLNDITSYKHHTSHLEHKVNHDVLTGLANRALLLDRLEQALHASQRNKTMVATVLIDLDNFKMINDTMGHDAGDEVLRLVARRLQASVRDSDTVARLGGDEFVLILSNQPSLRFTQRMIERLRLNMARPMPLQGRDMAIELSLGVSVFPHDGVTADTLLQAADVAMYHAKRAGRNGVHFFSGEMKPSGGKAEASLRAAIEQNQVYLAFQPLVAAGSGAIVGAEALLRWRHPQRGLLLPAAFLPEAEENGLIIPLGQWVARAICTTLQRLGEIGFEQFALSMNLSLRELSQPEYLVALGRMLAEFSLAPQRLELEVRESYLTRNLELAREILPQIGQLGLGLTIEEFGAGLSSLGDLQRHAVSHLKMSKSLLDDVRRNADGGALVRTVIGIGHTMDIAVIADGVETGSQLSFLRQNGCDQVQGNYLSEPVCSKRLEQLLMAGPLAPH